MTDGSGLFGFALSSNFAPNRTTIHMNMTKAILLAAAVVLTAGAANAQYKPVAGEQSLEVNFAPLGGSPISIGGIKYRSFSSETTALRLGVFLGYGSSNKVTQDDDSALEQVELSDSKSTFSFNIQPGIEKHFAGTDRLSPYIGGVFALGFTATTEKEEQQVADKKVGITTTKGGNFSVGLNAVAGFDYYLASKLYLGTEVGFGLALSNDRTKKISYENIPGAVDSESNVDTQSRFDLGPNVIAQIRLGWIF